MINFLTANTNCSPVGCTTIIVSLGVIFALFVINLYSTVVFRKPIKNIWKIIGFTGIFFAVGIIFVIGKIIEDSESANLYSVSILSIIATWVWFFSYFGEFWSPEKHGNDLFARNLFAIIGIMTIASQLYLLIKFLNMAKAMGAFFISANIIIFSISFFVMREDAQYCFY